MAERLGENVRELPTSFDELDDDMPSIDTVPEEVKLDVDVLCSDRGEPDSSRWR